ncbi:MAG: metal ABC transporter permease [SAR202 cluster bacterium]|nr:metal ABC transporter permease [SAR202 cluster bacterium]|tara:strand:+ start:8450 stop:9277 length:828 start_codon:yes stop_codon:yes gene_type:complete
MGFEYFLEPFSYDFMVRSLLVAVMVGVMLPLLGAYVINRNMEFMGDAIAHASLPGLIIGLILGVSVFVASIPSSILIALLIGYLINKSRLGEGTSIGIIFSSMFALGFILLSIFDDIALSVEDVLLGQILGVSDFDVYITLILTLIVIVTLLFLHKQFLFLAFDPVGAKVSGLNTQLLNNIFLILLALSIMGSLQSVGIILLLSMLITPAAAAKIVMKNFYALMIVGSLFGVLSSVSGLYLSYYLDLPSGPSMALSATCVFVVVWSLRKSLMYGK